MITTTIGSAGLAVLALYFFLAGIMGTALGFGFSAAGALALVLLGARMGYPLLLCLSIINLLFTMRILGAHMAPISKWGAHGHWRYLLGGSLGAPLGLYLLFAASQSTLKIALGLFILVCAIYFIVRPHSDEVQGDKEDGAATGVFFGLLGGIAGGFSAFPTAPLVAWMRFKNASKERLLSVTQPFALSMQALCLAIATFENPDLWSEQMLMTMAWCVPSTLLGTWLGAKVFRRLSEATHAKFTAWALLGCGVMILMATSGGQSGLAAAVAAGGAQSNQLVQSMPRVGAIGLKTARSLAHAELSFGEGESRLDESNQHELDRAWDLAMGDGVRAGRLRVTVPLPGIYDARKAMAKLGPTRQSATRKYLAAKALRDGVEASFEEVKVSRNEEKDTVAASKVKFEPNPWADLLCLPSPLKMGVELRLARAE
jgi:uncharacterized membrane protein YfcA